MSMTIDFLYWPECPSHPEAWDLLHKVLADAGVQATINKQVVETEAEAEAADFIGSPTIRIDGRDVDPSVSDDMPARLTCRMYFREDGRPSAIPTENMIRNALQRAMQRNKED